MLLHSPFSATPRPVNSLDKIPSPPGTHQGCKRATYHLYAQIKRGKVEQEDLSSGDNCSAYSSLPEVLIREQFVKVGICYSLCSQCLLLWPSQPVLLHYLAQGGIGNSAFVTLQLAPLRVFRSSILQSRELQLKLLYRVALNPESLMMLRRTCCPDGSYCPLSKKLGSNATLPGCGSGFGRGSATPSTCNPCGRKCGRWRWLEAMRWVCRYRRCKQLWWGCPRSGDLEPSICVKHRRHCRHTSGYGSAATRNTS